ncbi:MAG: hypothetical protein H6629_17960 [Calditrichae bacterium]|nr:hypothetical protein [Calditrichia bacterium]
MTKVAPPSVEMLKPSFVAAYTVLPLAKTSQTMLLLAPLAVVRLTKVAPPSVEMLKPSFVAAYTVLPLAKMP